MRFIVGGFLSIVPVFIGCVAGLYIFQAVNTPLPWFTKHECWTIGLISFLVGTALSLNNYFQWVR